MHFLSNFPLAPFNTFGVKALARAFAVVSNEQALLQWCASRDREVQPLLIGGGSNVLITGAVIDAPVLQIAPRGARVVSSDGDTVLVEAMAGEPWHAFVQWSLSQNLFGLENLSLIPGYVGGAPVQNIGAYGVEIAELCDSVQTVDLHTAQPREFSAAQCAFDYRDSVFKKAQDSARDRYAIMRVRFRLSRKFSPRLDYGDIKAQLQHDGVARPTAMDVSRAVSEIRRRKLPDPSVLGNAGSFFKNPVVDAALANALKARFAAMPQFVGKRGVKLAAGWLIEQAGWKGRGLSAHSAAAVHADHALVLVNRGGATGEDIWALARAVQSDVQEKFGVMLEPEPRVI